MKGVGEVSKYLLLSNEFQFFDINTIILLFLGNISAYYHTCLKSDYYNIECFCAEVGI